MKNVAVVGCTVTLSPGEGNKQITTEASLKVKADGKADIAEQKTRQLEKIEHLERKLERSNTTQAEAIEATKLLWHEHAQKYLWNNRNKRQKNKYPW